MPKYVIRDVGTCIYIAPEGWSPDINQAQQFDSVEEAQRRVFAAKYPRRLIVYELYLSVGRQVT